MAAEEWAVALILLAVSGALVASVAAICHMLGVWRFPNLFGPPSSEKQQLTKHEEPCYMVTSESELNLSASGTFKHFDTGDARCLDLPPEPPIDQPTYDIKVNPEWVGSTELPIDQPTYDIKVSPESVGSTVSDYEPAAGLQRALSCDSVASDSSILDVEPEAPKIGQLEFGLEYDREVSEFIVSVIQARDLEASEVTGSLDSYVKVSLTPHRDGKVQTKVQKGTTNPVYHERFLFSVESDELPLKTLLLQVYSSDKYARHKLLGESDLKVGDIEMRHPLRIWMNLRDMDERPSDYGNMMFSLSYLPTAERLTVVLVKVRNVKWSRGKEMGDCFVKVYLLQNGKRVVKKKTSTKRGEKNPIFNEAMIFSVPASILQTVQLRIRVMEQLPNSEVSSLGHVIVGSQLSGTELTHWSQMLSSLRKPVAMWHSLRK